METNPETFYHSYVKDYHEVKAVYLKSLLDNIDSVNETLKKSELEYQGTKVPLTNNTKFIIQADLRQNYFHAIETFFEFYFAFLPNKGKVPDNGKILRQLVKSNWRKNYKSIEQIAGGKMKLNFFIEKVNFLGHNVSIGHYLFYPGTFSKEKFGNEYLEAVNKSLESVKEAIRKLATDFCDRGEYNAYKHTMRVFPTYDSIHFLNAKTLKKEFEFDLSNSASYQVYNDRDNETMIKTKMFDPDRDFNMTKLCSRLIYNMLELRNVMFNSSKIENKDKKIAIMLFHESNITDATKHNVEIQDLTFSSKKI